MKSYQLAAAICIMLCMISCSGDLSSDSSNITSSKLSGHWDITVPSGLMFMEFTDEHKVLIGDRGAIGTIDISQHYYQDYIISGDQIVGLPSETRMEDIEIRGDRMTFTFYNPQTEKKTPYTGIRVTELMEDKQTALLNKTWVTVTENELPVADEDKKMAYFSKTGIFFIKDFGSEKLNMFSWEWRNEVQLCYTEYQRPQFVYDPTCMSFSLLLEEQVKFYVDGDNIMMEPGFE